MCACGASKRATTWPFWTLLPSATMFTSTRLVQPLPGTVSGVLAAALISPSASRVSVHARAARVSVGPAAGDEEASQPDSTAAVSVTAAASRAAVATGLKEGGIGAFIMRIGYAAA